MKKLWLGILISVPACSAMAMFQSHKLAWIEHIYPEDGFAITVPYAPNPHKDASNPSINVYTVELEERVGVTLRVVLEPRDCPATLAKLKNDPGRVPGSQKDISLEGHPGLEYEVDFLPGLRSVQRFYCADSRFYIFAATYPRNLSRPASVSRIMNSLRLLKKEPPK